MSRRRSTLVSIGTPNHPSTRINDYSRRYGEQFESGKNSGYVTSDQYRFGSVTGTKVRISFDNLNKDFFSVKSMDHGWLYEFEVYDDRKVVGDVFQKTTIICLRILEQTEHLLETRDWSIVPNSGAIQFDWVDADAAHIALVNRHFAYPGNGGYQQAQIREFFVPAGKRLASQYAEARGRNWIDTSYWQDAKQYETFKNYTYDWTSRYTDINEGRQTLHFKVVQNPHDITGNRPKYET